MSAPCLCEIEKALYTLWTNRKARERLLYGSSVRSKAKNAAESDILPPDLLKQIDKNGVRLYAELLNIGYLDLMTNVFPGCAKLIGDKWGAVVEKYFERFPPAHHNLNRAAEHFSEYLCTFEDRYLRKYPFIGELANYEWLELELLEHPGEIKTHPHAPLTNPELFTSFRPVVNPLLTVRRYKFPIAKIVDHLGSDCCLPKNVAPEATCMAVYREPQTHQCRFLEIGETTAAIIELALAVPTSYKDLLAFAVRQSADVDPQQCVVNFLEMIEKLQKVNLLVGSAQMT